MRAGTTQSVGRDLTETAGSISAAFASTVVEPFVLTNLRVTGTPPSVSALSGGAVLPDTKVGCDAVAVTTGVEDVCTQVRQRL